MFDVLIEIKNGSILHNDLRDYQDIRFHDVAMMLHEEAYIQMTRENHWRRWFLRKPMTREEAEAKLKAAHPRCLGNSWEEASAYIHCSGVIEDNATKACLDALDNGAETVYMTGGVYRAIRRTIESHKRINNDQ